MRTSVHFHASAPLPPTGPGSIEQGAEGGPEPIWTLWRIHNLVTLPGIEPQFLGYPAHGLVTILTKTLRPLQGGGN
jgi:hypothetical protein